MTEDKNQINLTATCFVEVQILTNTSIRHIWWSTLNTVQRPPTTTSVLHPSTTIIHRQCCNKKTYNAGMPSAAWIPQILKLHTCQGIF